MGGHGGWLAVALFGQVVATLVIIERVVDFGDFPAARLLSQENQDADSISGAKGDGHHGNLAEHDGSVCCDMVGPVGRVMVLNFREIIGIARQAVAKVGVTQPIDCPFCDIGVNAFVQQRIGVGRL